MPPFCLELWRALGEGRGVRGHLARTLVAVSNDMNTQFWSALLTSGALYLGRRGWEVPVHGISLNFNGFFASQFLLS